MLQQLLHHGQVINAKHTIVLLKRYASQAAT